MHADSTGLVTVSTLAQGGMGRVDLALRREAGFARAYAVKRLRDEVVGDERLRALFLREARVAGLVRHPNVVSVLDFGVDSAGPYLVMDFVPGMSLAHLQRAARARGGLPIQAAVRIAKDMAAGLHAAHEVCDEGQWLALVHRDVTPENVLIGLDGIARITDFGIAKSALASGETTGTLLRGKVGYLAPEQLRFTATSRSTDLFALGVVLFEMVAGKTLYHEGDLEHAARRILEEDPPDLQSAAEEVPPALSQLVASLLRKTAEERPGDARLVERALDSILCDLVLHEGPRFVVDYLERELESEVAAARSVLAEAWREFGVVEVLKSEDTPRLAQVFDAPVGPLVLDAPSEPPSSSRDPSPVARASRPMPPPPPPPRAVRATTRRGYLVAGALGLVALVALGYALGVAVSQPAQDLNAREAPVEAPDESEYGADPALDDEGAFEIGSASGADEADEAGEDETPGAERPRPRARRRRRPRSGASGSKLWEW